VFETRNDRDWFKIFYVAIDIISTTPRNPHKFKDQLNDVVWFYGFVGRIYDCWGEGVPGNIKAQIGKDQDFRIQKAYTLIYQYDEYIRLR